VAALAGSRGPHIEHTLGIDEKVAHSIQGE
jgi:hypothetical protein